MSDLLKRRGRLKIREDLIEKNPDGVLKSLSDMLVVRVDNDFMTRTLTYVGYSKQFDIIDDCEIIPNYIAEIDIESKQVKLHREKEYTEKDVKSMLEAITNEIRKTALCKKTTT